MIPFEIIPPLIPPSSEATALFVAGLGNHPPLRAVPVLFIALTAYTQENAMIREPLAFVACGREVLPAKFVRGFMGFAHPDDDPDYWEDLAYEWHRRRLRFEERYVATDDLTANLSGPIGVAGPPPEPEGDER